MQFIGEREEGINIGRSKVREYSIRMQVPREGEWLEGEEGEEACGGKEESEHGNEVLHAFVAVLPSVACLPSFSCAACVRALQTSLNTHPPPPPPPKHSADNGIFKSKQPASNRTPSLQPSSVLPRLVLPQVRSHRSKPTPYATRQRERKREAGTPQIAVYPSARFLCGSRSVFVLAAFLL